MQHLGIYLLNEADQNKIIKDIFDYTYSINFILSSLIIVHKNGSHFYM